MTAGDIDHDRDFDLAFTTRTGRQLFENEGDCTFREITGGAFRQLLNKARLPGRLPRALITGTADPRGSEGRKPVEGMVAMRAIRDSARCALGLTLIALALTSSATSALALPLTARTQLGVSRSYVWTGGADFWTVWARRGDGHLVALRSQPLDPTQVWTDYGLVTNRMVGAQGVSSTSWTVGATQHERAYFMDATNLVEVGLVNRVQTLGRALGAPPGSQILTGYLSVSRRYDAASAKNYTLVFLTAKDPGNQNLVRLWVCQIDTTNNTFNWFQLGTQTDYSPTFPIAASNTTDGSSARVFAGTTAGTLRHVRWNGVSAFVLSLSQPAGVSVCSTLAAAEGDLGGGTGYRVYVFCTQRGAAEPRVRYRSSASSLGDAIGNWSAWSSTNAPAGQGNAWEQIATTPAPSSTRPRCSSCTRTTSGRATLTSAWISGSRCRARH